MFTWEWRHFHRLTGPLLIQCTGRLYWVTSLLWATYHHPHCLFTGTALPAEQRGVSVLSPFSNSSHEWVLHLWQMSLVHSFLLLWPFTASDLTSGKPLFKFFLCFKLLLCFCHHNTTADVAWFYLNMLLLVDNLSIGANSLLAHQNWLTSQWKQNYPGWTLVSPIRFVLWL